jgi:membrane protein implicated in regulation of membrane protease activity
MTWADFYLTCFLIGFAFSVISLVVGALDLHLHLPHIHFGGGDLFHFHGTHAGGEGPSPFNIATFAAFLAWFGGTGFLLSHYYGVWYLAALAVAFVSGIGGAALVFWFLFKVLMSKEENLDPADYDMVGVLGRVTIPIRPGGTGEIVFSQAGTRHVAGARSEDGTPVAKGEEVVVTGYEKGIAFVRRWEDLAGEQPETKERSI